MKKINLWSLWTVLMVAIMSVVFVSCGDDDNTPSQPTKDEIVQNLMSHKWTGSSTDYDVYSYGDATFTQTWTVYFTSNQKGVMHIRTVDRDSALGTTRNEEHLDFTYIVDGTKIRLSGESNYVFDYKGSYMMIGDDIFTASAMTSEDYTYLQDHEKGYHGTNGRIDAIVFIIEDNEIFKRAIPQGNGWYGYYLQFGFGAYDDAYQKGMTQMKLTYWADNGCVDKPYQTYNYGKKITEILYLSPVVKDWYDMIFVFSKETTITFNYQLEYYNSKDGKWYDLQNRKLTFSAQ